MLNHPKTFLLAGISLLLAGCSGSVSPTEFANPQFDFGFVERVAVIPFENLTRDQNAGRRASRIMATELLASGALDVVEAGEVQAALAKRPGATYGRIAIPSKEDVLTLGQELNVQALILGTVAQSETLRSGRVGIPVVTIDARMVETETGTTVWAATHTEKGSSFSAKVLGTSGTPISETTRLCVRQLLKSLVE
ncbi:MAG: hypothetical protein GWP16_01730 [Nitrospirae bacterium]|nr:hypothetical protein [Nitrospirota bacterium]